MRNGSDKSSEIFDFLAFGSALALPYFRNKETQQCFRSFGNASVSKVDQCGARRERKPIRIGQTEPRQFERFRTTSERGSKETRSVSEKETGGFRNSAIRNRKGQALLPDYVASLAIFAVVIMISLIVWNVAESKKTWTYNIDLMQKKAMTAADTLIKSGGIPEGWTNETVEEIGISSSDHMINGTLVDNMLEVDYAAARTIFGLESYDFYINITNYTGGVIASYGLAPQNARDLTLVRRISYFQNDSAPVRSVVAFYVWR